jgi:LacI family transcriptional regulator
MSVTQRDIADHLAISLITVHRALNNSGYVSAELKERILSYVKEVNYVPHKASQVLVRNKTRKIAVFTSSLPRYFWTDVKTGVMIGTEQIQAFNYQVHYHMVPERDSRSYLEILAKELSEGLEAVAFANQWIYDMEAILSRIDESGIPYVTLNIDAPDSRRQCYIGPDYAAGGRLAAEFIGKSLMFKDSPRVLVINTLAERPSGSSAPDINRLRLDGFSEVMRNEFPGVDFETDYSTTGTASGRIEKHLEQLLRARAKAFDAIYLVPAYNAQFVRVIEGIGIEKVVVVLHDLDTSSYHYLEKDIITAVIYQNPILQGYYAVKILEQILESGRRPESETITIVHSLVFKHNKDIYKNHYLFAKLTE